MVNYKWLSPVVLMVLISGAWVTLTPTEDYDVCRVGNDYGSWTNVSETVYVNEKLSAVGKYSCDIEGTEFWCGRTTKTRCYYILEEALPIKAQIPQKPNKYIDWEDYESLTKYELDDKITHRGIYLKHDSQLEYLRGYYPGKIDRMELALDDALNSTDKEINNLENIQYLKDKIARLKDKYALVILDLDVRETKLLDRNPIGTTYYIDNDNGDDNANNGTETYAAWQTISRYTTTTVRSPGDIGYVRAGMTYTQSLDLNFDEDGAASARLYLRGATSTDDPWSDASDVKPKISFGSGAYQLRLYSDTHWSLENLNITQSTDSSGIIYISNSAGTIIDNCDVNIGIGTAVEGIYIITTIGALINNSRIYNVGDDAVYITASSHILIENTEIYGGAQGTNNGVYNYKGYNVGITNCSFGRYYAFSSDEIYTDGYTRVLNTYFRTNDMAMSNGLLTIEGFNKSFGDNRNYRYRGNIFNESTIIRSGGASSSAKMIPQSILVGQDFPLTLSANRVQGDFQIWTPASTTTITVYIRGYGWASYPTADELFISTSYLDQAGGSGRSTVKSSQTISDNTNWVAFTNTFTPARAGFAYTTVSLGKYVSGDGVYVDIKPVVS